MVFFVGAQLQRPGIDYFFARRVGESAVGKRENPDDDENDADDSGRSHRCELTMVGGLGSTG